MRVGLYFGSFNPIHTGHLIIASHVLENCGLDQIWFVVSPQNPLKESKSLLNEYNRLHLVKLAIKDNPKFKASDIEFHLPKPSFTIDTLTYLDEKFPKNKFSVIMGSDSFQNLHRWKNPQQLLDRYPLIIYTRPGFDLSSPLPPGCTPATGAPMLDISATFLREQIRQGKSIQYLTTDEVAAYIQENRYYS